MPVNKQAMREWVAALRSGEFDQGRNVLKRVMGHGSFSYCCLGVACEVAVRAGVKVSETIRKGSKYDVVLFGGRSGDLPSGVMKHFGLATSDPVLVAGICGEQESITAIGANDFKGWSFNEIADAIEAHYELKENPNG